LNVIGLGRRFLTQRRNGATPAGLRRCAVAPLREKSLNKLLYSTSLSQGSLISPAFHPVAQEN